MRMMTRGVQTDIPLELQLFMWALIDALPEPKDYLQVFRLSSCNGRQKIVHTQEQPEYSAEYLLNKDYQVNKKVFVIDDIDYITMLLAEEY